MLYERAWAAGVPKPLHVRLDQSPPRDDYPFVSDGTWGEGGYAANISTEIFLALCRVACEDWLRARYTIATEADRPDEPENMRSNVVVFEEPDDGVGPNIRTSRGDFPSCTVPAMLEGYEVIDRQFHHWFGGATIHHALVSAVVAVSTSERLERIRDRHRRLGH